MPLNFRKWRVGLIPKILDAIARFLAVHKKFGMIHPHGMECRSIKSVIRAKWSGVDNLIRLDFS